MRSSTDQPAQNTETSARAVSRRRLLTGLIGSGALLLLGGPGIYASVKSTQRTLAIRELHLSDTDRAAAWSNDLEYAAIQGQESLKVWLYEQERVSHTFRIDLGEGESRFVWSPDNRRLMAVTQQQYSNARLICWDVQTQQQLYTATGDFYISLSTLSWSPDGQKIAAFYDNSKLFILDASNGKTISTQKFRDIKGAPDYTIKAQSWSPDSTRVALLVEQSETREHSVVIWDVVHQRQAMQLGKQTSDKDNYQNTPLAWSPAGDYLATVLNKKLQLLHVSDSSKNVIFSNVFEEDYHLLAWEPGGQYLAATDSGQISIWDSRKKEQVRVLYRGQVAFRIEKLAWPSKGQEVSFINDTDNLVHYTW